MRSTTSMATGSVLRVRDFRLLFAGTAASKLGSEVTFVALPLVAVISLQATPVQVGLLGSATMVAFLVVGLPAGAWVDRIRRRGVMIAADIVRAILLSSVPVAWWLDVLTIEQLFVIALCSGLCTVFFDVAAHSYLPALIGRDRLVEGNAKLSGIDAVTRIAGRGVGGYLITLLTAPVAVLVTAAGYLWSGICLVSIRSRESKPTVPEHRHLLREVREGLNHVLGDRSLRAITAYGAIANFCHSFVVAMLPVLFADELGMSTTIIGLFFALGGVGAVAGAALVQRVVRRLGHGPALWILPLVVMPTYVLIPITDHGFLLWLAGAAYLLQNTRIMIESIVQVSYRQWATPDRLLGRMNGTVRFLMLGSIAIGAVLSGVLAAWLGVRGALWVSAAGNALAWLTIFFSPLRTMHELPNNKRNPASDC